MSKRTTRSLMMVAALASASVTSANAQDPRVLPRLDAPSRAAIAAVVDSAKAQGIPVEPLYDKVNEGVVKGADGPHIVVAVRNLALDLATAHRALGALATADEIKAAASAMHAGVPAVELGKLKKQSGLRRSLTLPFTVLADIVSRGVPVSTAANAIRSLVGAGAKDKDINDFQRNVKVDIEQGAPPAAAAETRAKGAAKPENLDQIGQ
ncbi:MAG TPA: hypothetical protein VIJ90_02190 [Gemmatimonadaceae bacterium]